MTAHWVVLAAAALTTLVAAAVGAALVAFGGQALPQAVRDDLSAAPGTSLVATAPVSGSQAGHVTAALRRAVGAALPGIPFAFWRAWWSRDASFGVLPRLVAPSLDLSVFTGSVAAVGLAPDLASFAVPLGGLVVVAVVALSVEIGSARRRGVATSVRVGE